MFFTVSLTYSEITVLVQFVSPQEITCFINVQTPRTAPGKRYLLSFCTAPLNIVLYSPFPVHSSGRFTSVFLHLLSPFWQSACGHGTAGVYYFSKQLDPLLQACISLQINFSRPLSSCCCFLTSVPDGQQAPVLRQDQLRCHSILRAAVLVNSSLETGEANKLYFFIKIYFHSSLCVLLIIIYKTGLIWYQRKY